MNLSVGDDLAVDARRIFFEGHEVDGHGHDFGDDNLRKALAMEVRFFTRSSGSPPESTSTSATAAGPGDGVAGHDVWDLFMRRPAGGGQAS